MAMSLQTPTTIRARQWKLISQGEDALRAGVSSHDISVKRPTIVCLAEKPIGKPCAGNPHARFDERGWETERWPSAPSYRAHPRLYRSARSLRCGDSVCYLRDLRAVRRWGKRTIDRSSPQDSGDAETCERLGVRIPIPLVGVWAVHGVGNPVRDNPDGRRWRVL